MNKSDEPDVTLQAREAEYERFVWSNLRRNYAAHYLHGMLGMTGFRLFNAPTFVPAYLHALTGSDAMVGLGLALQQLGGIIMPIAGAVHIEHRKRVMPVAVLLGTLMRLQILGVALAGFILDGQARVVVTFFFLFMLGICSAPQQIAFQFLLAKVIPVIRRGRLQAWRNVTGGAIAALLAYAAGRYIVEANVWGNGYATTFLLAFILTSLGLTAMRLFIREPEPPTIRPRMAIRDRVREFPALLKGDRGFFYFMIARTFGVAGRIAAPFYILYASRAIELTGTNIGLLSLAYLGADTVTNLGWGYMADRRGYRSTFIASLALWIGATLLLMGVHDINLILLAFFGLGAAQSGHFMSSQTIVLEFGDRDNMPMRLALSNMAEAVVAALGPLLGGIMAAALGYAAVFSVSMVFQVIALVVLVLFVDEPRLRKMRL